MDADTGADAKPPPAITDEHIAELHELTGWLVQDAATRNGGPRPDVWALYHGDGGDWIAQGLLHDTEVAALVCEAPAGMTLPQHLHEQPREWLLVVRGAIRVEAQGIASVYLRGDCAMIAPGVAHTVTTLEPTRLVAVTIPAEPSYPPGLRGGCDE